MTGICVQDIAPAARGKWLSVARECGYATYFHTPYWYELIAPKQKHITAEVTFSDGASAVIPMAKIKRFCGLLTDVFSSPGGTYGGWVSTSALTPEHVKHLFRVLASESGLTFRVNPFDPSSRFIGIDNDGGISGINIKNDFTHVLDLTKGERSITLGMSKGHKSAIKSAARAGVTVRAALTEQEWDKYYGLYLDTIWRWRAGKMTIRAVYPASLFKRLYENRTENETLWLAFKDGEPIAGALIFYWNGHAVSWHASASSRHLNLRPNNLLYWEIISDAVKRGCRLFDFNPSGGYGGVESFKSHFGTQRLPTPTITTRSPLRRMLAGLRG
ncbi:hypothetical protein R80B4_00983 [Fibrobacteres bacterium R8-0-B4]